jgi:hypothetical protein
MTKKQGTGTRTDTAGTVWSQAHRRIAHSLSHEPARQGPHRRIDEPFTGPPSCIYLSIHMTFVLRLGSIRVRIRSPP